MGINSIILILFVVVLTKSDPLNETFHYSISPDKCNPTIGTFTVLEGRFTKISLMSCYADACDLTPSTEDISIVEVENIDCQPYENGFAMNITVSAKYIGITELIFLKSGEHIKTGNEILVIRYRHTPLTIPKQCSKRRTIDKLYNYVLTSLLVCISFGFGCQLNLVVVLEYLKRPVAPLVAAGCQFIIMPTIGIALTLAFSLDPTMSLGLLSVACSPGGGASNSWAFLLGGDPDLSLTMTFISLTFALGMMPLWLYMATEYVIDLGDHVKVPYTVIARTLAMFVLPCFLGIILGRFFKDLAAKLAKWIITPLSIVFLFWVLIVGTYINLYMFRVMARYATSVVPVAMLLPWIGMLLGFSLTRYLAGQNNKVSITVAIETGIQNMGIPIVMLQGYFAQPYGDLAATVVQCVGMFTPIPLYIVLVGLKVNRFYRRYKDKQTYKEYSIVATRVEIDPKEEVEEVNLNESRDEQISQPEMLYP